MVQLAMAAVPPKLPTPPPEPVAELSLTVQLFIVSETAPSLIRPPPLRPAELPLTVQLASVAVPRVAHAAAFEDGVVAADGAAGQQGCGARCTGHRRPRRQSCR